jgi:biopolymer transport protein ExbD
MNKKTIIILSLAVFLAGVLILRELVFYATKPSEEAMQMNLPPDDLNLTEPKPERDSEKIEVNYKGAVTFLLTANDNIYYYRGEFNDVISKTDFNKVGELINKYNTDINEKNLMFIIKADTSSTFKNAINMLDQMAINNVPAGHYAELTISNNEIESIKKFKEK